MAALPWLGHASWKYLTHSPFFEIRHVVVRGNHHVPTKNVRQIIADVSGENVLKLDKDRIASALIATGWVKRVDISRDLPRTVYIDVQEFVPVATIVTDGIHLIEASGDVFRTIEPKDPIVRPMITGITHVDPEIQYQLIRRALILAESYKQAGMNRFDPLTIIHHDPARGFALVTEQHRVVAYIGHEEFAKRIQKLRFVIDDALRRGKGVPGTIHADLGDQRVVVKPRISNSATQKPKFATDLGEKSPGPNQLAHKRKL
tara:strand:- start:2639 stop:3418 length:780 start_codon:yes stop_codon:yes gene_type:complete